MRLARTVLAFVPVGLLLAVADASAQDKGKTGITMGYPSSIGFVTHITERFAIRPELNLNIATSETSSPVGDITADSSLLGVGFSALIYLGQGDKLRPYVSPRYVFTRTSTSPESPFGELHETTLTAHSLAGSFGAQYSLHDRFSVFGEVGVGHTFDRRTSGTSGLRLETRVFSTRTGVGVTFYF